LPKHRHLSSRLHYLSQGQRLWVSVAFIGVLGIYSHHQSYTYLYDS